MKKYFELMREIDLIKSIKPQEIDSYLTEGSCKITQYGGLPPIFVPSTELVEEAS